MRPTPPGDYDTARPTRRLLLMIFRPLRVFIRARKPTLRMRVILEVRRG